MAKAISDKNESLKKLKASWRSHLPFTKNQLNDISKKDKDKTKNSVIEKKKKQIREYFFTVLDNGATYVTTTTSNLQGEKGGIRYKVVNTIGMAISSGIKRLADFVKYRILLESEIMQLLDQKSYIEHEDWQQLHYMKKKFMDNEVISGEAKCKDYEVIEEESTSVLKGLF